LLLADSILGLSSGVPPYTEGGPGRGGQSPSKLELSGAGKSRDLVKIVRLARKIKLAISEERGGGESDARAVALVC
jgi:hypothetical protein